MSTENTIEITQYLTFRLEDEIFAIEVKKVREVFELSNINITRVPNVPDFMKGVINVRGSVVPIVDFRLKFGMTETERTFDTRIVVMELSIDGETTVMGAIADLINEVIDLTSEQIEVPPKIGCKWRSGIIKWIGKKDNEIIIILDIEEIFSSDELSIARKGTTE